MRTKYINWRTHNPNQPIKYLFKVKSGRSYAHYGCLSMFHNKL